MRFSRLPLWFCASAGAALLVAACGGTSAALHTGAGRTVTVNQRTVTVTAPQSTSPAATDTGPLTDTTATATTTTVSGPECNASDLTASYLGSNGAAGTIVLGFALKNTGSSACQTYGWPGVAFLSSSGAPLPTGATRTTGDVVGSTPANVLTLAPGQEASFRMVTSDMGPGGVACATAAALQIYAPNDTTTVEVALPGVAACGQATVSPMMPGASAFGGQPSSATSTAGAGAGGGAGSATTSSGAGSATTSSGGASVSS